MYYLELTPKSIELIIISNHTITARKIGFLSDLELKIKIELVE
jgi:hypothetical protein